MFGFFSRRKSARRAARKLLDDATRGDARAQFELGNRHAGGTEFAARRADAVSWWTRAAEQGLPEAQYNLALALYDGRLAAQDFRASARWCRRAAEQGHGDAQFWLGLMYRRGQGVRPNDGEALKWILGAADQGHALAQHTLAVLLAEMFAGRDDCIDLALEAYMWSRIANDRLWGENRAAAEKLRAAIAQRLTAEQIAEAERRARDWRAMPSPFAGAATAQADTSAAAGAGGVQAAYLRQK